MKKIILMAMLAIAASFFFVSCDNNNTRFVPVTDTLYKKGTETITQKEFRVLKGDPRQIVNSCGKTVTIRRTYLDSLIVKTGTLQGDPVTEQLYKIDQPDQNKGKIGDGSNNGGINNGNCNCGFWYWCTSPFWWGLPGWLWLLIALIIIVLLIWNLLRNRDVNHTHTHTHNLNEYIPHVTALTTAMNNNTAATERNTDAVHNNSGQMFDNNRHLSEIRERLQQVVDGNASGKGIKVKIEGGNKENEVMINWNPQTGGNTNSDPLPIDVHFAAQCTGKNKVTINYNQTQK